VVTSAVQARLAGVEREGEGHRMGFSALLPAPLLQRGRQVRAPDPGGSDIFNHFMVRIFLGSAELFGSDLYLCPDTGAPSRYGYD